MPTPDAAALSTYRKPNADQADAVISVVKAMVSAHTRGEGFTEGEPNDELGAVILSASARLIANTAGLSNEAMGAFQIGYGRGDFGFTLPELMVLNRYRKRAR